MTMNKIHLFYSWYFPIDIVFVGKGIYEFGRVDGEGFDVYQNAPEYSRNKSVLDRYFGIVSEWELW